MTLEEFDTESVWAHKAALVLACSVWMIRDHPNEKEREFFRKGIRQEDLEKWFPIWMWRVHDKDIPEKERKRVDFVKYDNALRYNFHGVKGNPETRRMGKHYIERDVNNDGNFKPVVHYFPLCLDEQGLIDHSRCVNCEKPEQ